MLREKYNFATDSPMDELVVTHSLRFIRLSHLKEKKEWFRDWFDSPYYHILYKNHDYNEAELFIDAVAKFLLLEKNKRILDVGCGKGRHSIHLFKKGYLVKGIDLSPENIKYASQFSNDRLSFAVGDMRHLLLSEQYDCILNLFTSFGFFESDLENLQVLQSFKNSLVPQGKLVLDFMNTEKVIKSLVKKEIKEVDDITFNIERSYSNGFIVKKIYFSDAGQDHTFYEKVKAITYNDFINYFKFAGLKIITLFGNYSLQNFDVDNSDRIIFILETE